MFAEQIIFYFKILIISTYLFAGILFYNPIINVFNIFPHFKWLVERFFYKTGLFGYWGVFTRMTDISKELKLTIRTDKGDYVWYFLRDKKHIPFFELQTDNTMVLFVHHINPGAENNPNDLRLIQLNSGLFKLDYYQILGKVLPDNT